MKNSIKFIVTFICLAFLSSSIFAGNGVNVVLANQNPDPVSPGNFVYVNVKVSNPGNNDIANARLDFIENSNFKIASGEELTKELGIIPAFSNSESSTSFVIGKYKIFVEEGTPLGLNTIDFRVQSGGQTYNYEFDLLVQDSNPKLDVVSINSPTIKAGENGDFSLELENTNSIEIRDIRVSLKLDEVEEEVFSVLSGSNEKLLSNLKIDEKKLISFQLVAAPQASSKPYLLPIEIEYEDSLGNIFTSDILASVRVNSEPELRVEVDSQEKYDVGSGRVIFAIANPGTSTIKGVQVEILEGNNYKILEGGFHYVGDLNPDDFQTIASQVFLESSKNTKVNLKIKYLDSYNQKIEETLILDLTTFNDEELKMFSGQTESSFSFATLILLIVVSVISFVIGRKKGYKKAKKH